MWCAEYFLGDICCVQILLPVEFQSHVPSVAERGYLHITYGYGFIIHSFDFISFFMTYFEALLLGVHTCKISMPSQWIDSFIIT